MPDADGRFSPIRLDCAMCGATDGVAFRPAVQVALCPGCAAAVLGPATPEGPPADPDPPRRIRP